MTQFKFNGKTVIVEDGCNVEIEGDEIRVKPGTTAPQPVYVPIAVPNGPFVPQVAPSSPYAPIYPQPWAPWISPPTTATPYTPNVWPSITCSAGVSPLTIGEGVVPLTVGGFDLPPVASTN